jgi:hypothetical protein
MSFYLRPEVGTNLVKLLLILGISALIRPIPLDSRILQFDLPPWPPLRYLSSSWRGTVFLIESKVSSCSLPVSATRS